AVLVADVVYVDPLAILERLLFLPRLHDLHLPYPATVRVHPLVFDDLAPALLVVVVVWKPLLRPFARHERFDLLNLLDCESIECLRSRLNLGTGSEKRDPEVRLRCLFRCRHHLPPCANISATS